MKSYISLNFSKTEVPIFSFHDLVFFVDSLKAVYLIFLLQCMALEPLTFIHNVPLKSWSPLPLPSQTQTSGYQTAAMTVQDDRWTWWSVLAFWLRKQKVIGHFEVRWETGAVSWRTAITSILAILSRTQISMSNVFPLAVKDLDTRLLRT